MARIVQLTASSFLGGPERQMLDLARSLPSDIETVFAAFQEHGQCQPLLGAAREYGFRTVVIEHDRPRVLSACREIVQLLRHERADVLCTHGYKADLLGLPAARWAGVPIVAVSRGWTGAGRRAQVYEAVDRLALRWMDRVVCVSEAQRRKVLAAGTPVRKACVIRNAIRTERFAKPDPHYRDRLQDLFPERRTAIVGAAGRLSPEKGFDILVQAAPAVVRQFPDIGFVLFGEGGTRASLAAQVRASRLERHFVLAGFRPDLDQFIPCLDLLVLPSYTEGLPNVVLEALAAAVPVVATAVGGTPEVLEDGVSGYLVPAGEPVALANRIQDLLSLPQRREFGRCGRQTVLQRFSFTAQAQAYQELFGTLNRCAVGQTTRQQSAPAALGLRPTK